MPVGPHHHSSAAKGAPQAPSMPQSSSSSTAASAPTASFVYNMRGAAALSSSQSQQQQQQQQQQNTNTSSKSPSLSSAVTNPAAAAAAQGVLLGPTGRYYHPATASPAAVSSTSPVTNVTPVLSPASLLPSGAALHSNSASISVPPPSSVPPGATTTSNSGLSTTTAAVPSNPPIVSWNPLVPNAFVSLSNSRLRYYRIGGVGTHDAFHTDSHHMNIASGVGANETVHQAAAMRYGFPTNQYSNMNEQQHSLHYAQQQQQQQLYHQVNQPHAHFPHNAASHHETTFYLQSNCTLPSNATCCTWSPSFSNLLAIGAEDASIYLTNIKHESIHKAFRPPKALDKSKTRCVQWNQAHTNFVAHGIERQRGAPGLMIWDVNESGTDHHHASAAASRATRSTISENSTSIGRRGGIRMGGVSQQAGITAPMHRSASGGHSIQIDGSMVAESVYRPSFEYAVNESVYSVAWIPDAPKSLLAGTSKFIRIYDIRDHASSRSKSSNSFNAFTKNVLGMQFNPFDARILASYGSDDVYVRIWDMRNLSEPFVKRKITTSSTHSNRVVHMEWSQCEKNLLVTLTTEGDRIKLWNIPVDDKKSSYIPIAYKHSSYKNVYPLDADRITPLGIVRQYEGDVYDGSASHTSVPQSPLQQTPLPTSSHGSSNMRYSFSSSTPTLFGDSSERILTFSLSSTLPRRVLVGTQSLVKHIQIEKQSPQFAISPFGDVALAFDSSGFESRQTTSDEHDDISEIMRTRAKQSVGMNFQTNLNIAHEMRDEATIPLWEWATRLKKLNQLDGRQDERTFIYVGVRSILRFDKKKRKVALPFLNFGNGSGGVRSPLTPLGGGRFSSTSKQQSTTSSNNTTQMKDDSSQSPSPSQQSTSSSSAMSKPRSASLSVDAQRRHTEHRSPFQVHESDRRTVAMTLCGWHDHDILVQHGEHVSERDAAIAIFQFDLTKAADILTKLDNGNNNYSMLAFALYGFLEERRTAFRNASASLTNPYLRAAFGFLSSDGRDFSTVLKEKDIHLSDRTAFACMYLPDDQLLRYVDAQTDLATKHGDLEGILLTGLSKRGMHLMQNYVNNTNDIQTACLSFSHVVPLRFKDDQVEIWLHNYRELLDTWQFWELRAMLDTTLSFFTRSSIQHQNPGVVIRCTYCSYPLVSNQQQRTAQKKPNGIGQRFASTMRGSYSASVAPTATTCPNCKRALPKCSICLTPYGTSMRSLGETHEGALNSHNKLDYCFAWCRNCKHGGHVKHLLEWFSMHGSCPVSGCSCDCNSNPSRILGKKRST